MVGSVAAAVARSASSDAAVPVPAKKMKVTVLLAVRDALLLFRCCSVVNCVVERCRCDVEVLGREWMLIWCRWLLRCADIVANGEDGVAWRLRRGADFVREKREWSPLR